MSAGKADMETVFVCARCGECCRGAGGIVLMERDVARLASWFDITPADFSARYAERVGAKIRLQSSPSGACVFLETGGRCGVHDAKPDVCRAWPFFRGNMVDAVSLDMAGEGCPGIRRGVSFAAFIRTGAEYLLDHGIVIAAADPAAPSALMPAGMVRRMAGDDSGHGEGE